MITGVFIDGDNIHVNKIKFKKLMDNIEKDNSVIIKKIYGDWKKIDLNLFWNKYVIEFGLEEVQISRLAGKNSTDSKIIVDMMEKLYISPNIEKFILIGCDKDYIPLIKKIIENNKIFEVYGLKNQTSLSIINSCSKYYDIDRYVNKDKEYNIEVENVKLNINKLLEENEDMDCDEEKDNDEELYKDDLYEILYKIIKNNDDGITIGELKHKIREEGNRDKFGKEFNKLDIFIRVHYNNMFNTIVKTKGNKKIFLIKLK